MSTAFISHSSEDIELAMQLCDLLEERGIGCWIAPRDVHPGRSYAEECVRGIETGRAFVFLASAEAIKSVQVLSELEQAHKGRLPIFTVLIGNPPISKEVDYYISRLHWLKYERGSLEILADTLAKALSGDLAISDQDLSRPLNRTLSFGRRLTIPWILIATFLLVASLASAGFYWINRKLDLDTGRLGHVVVVQKTISLNPTDVAASFQFRTWLLAKGVPFGRVNLVVSGTEVQGGSRWTKRATFSNVDQVGGSEVVTVQAPATTERLTTCLILPSPALGGLYRVTQLFSVSAIRHDDGRREITLSERAEPEVSEEKEGQGCGLRS